MTYTKNPIISSVIWVEVLVIVAFSSSDFGTKKNIDQHHKTFQKNIIGQ